MARLASVFPWVLTGLLWLFYLIFTWNAYRYGAFGGGDFAAYYGDVQSWLNGGDLYGSLARDGYIYPPLFAQALAGIVRVAGGYYPSAAIWFGINIVLLFTTLGLLARHLATQRQRLLLWLGALCFIPVFDALWVGQITILITALIVGAWAAYKAERPLVTGVLLGIAVWTKFYPALFLVYFLWKRDWRVIGAAAATTGVVVGIQLLGGVDLFVHYFTEVLPQLTTIGKPHHNHLNNSLLAFAQRLFSSSNPYALPLVESPLLVALTRYGITALLLGSLLWLTTRPAAKDTLPAQFDLEYALVALTALLLGSILFIHGLVLLLLVYVLVVRSAAPSQTRRLALWLLVSALLVSLQLFVVHGYLSPPSDKSLPALALSAPFFGIMLVWAIAAFRLYDSFLSPRSRRAR